MFEFWFFKVDRETKTVLTTTDATTDFLELICRIAGFFNADVAGEFMTSLLRSKTGDIGYLRITTWNFEWSPILNCDKFHIKVVKSE